MITLCTSVKLLKSLNGFTLGKEKGFVRLPSYFLESVLLFRFHFAKILISTAGSGMPQGRNGTTGLLGRAPPTCDTLEDPARHERPGQKPVTAEAQEALHQLAVEQVTGSSRQGEDRG